MTNRNPKRGAPSGYRAPEPITEPQRRGLLDRLAPRQASVPVPKIRTGLAWAFTVVCTTPAITAGVAVYILLEWIVLVRLGFQGPFRVLVGVFAAPGLGSYFDGLLGSLILGPARSGIVALFGLIALRALLQALVATTAVERLRTDRITTWSLRRGLRVWPVSILVNVGSFGILITGNILGGLLGQGLGLLAFVGSMTVALYITASAAAIAADEDRGLGETLQRSYRSARLPGSGNLTLAAIYTLAGWAVALVYIPGGAIGVNPSIWEWVGVIGFNLVSVVVLVLLAFRYLSVAPHVPEPQAPARRR